jgi:uncharacterized membrane protein HdeD (DUF308 family)
VIFRVLVAVQPDAGALAVVWLIGAYALLFGRMLMALACRMRSMGKRLHASVPA